MGNTRKNIRKNTGIVRRLDELGRVTLPIELRRSMGIDVRDPIEIYTEGDKIILEKYEPSDIFTGSTENLLDYKGKKVSLETIQELASLAGLI